MNKIIAAVSTVAIAGTLLPETADAASLTTLNVKQDAAIYKESSSNSTIIHRLKEAQQLSIMDLKVLNFAVWYKITDGQSIVGWIPAKEINFPAMTSSMTVQGNYINVREGASTAYSTIAQLSDNQKVKVVAEFTNSFGEKWFRVDLGTIKGWVLSPYLKGDVTAAPAPAEEEKTSFTSYKATVTVEQAAVRKGATQFYDQVSVIKKGDVVTVIGQFTNSAGEKWVRVDLGEIKGWVPASSFTKISVQEPVSEPADEAVVDYMGKELVVIQEQAPVRKGATLSYDQVASLTKGDTHSAIDQFTNAAGETWIRIDLGDLKGWVKSASFNVVTEPDAPASENSMIINGNDTPVRKGATINYEIAATLHADQQVSVIDSFTNANGELWYRVDLGEIKGWVQATYFKSVSETEPESSEPDSSNTMTILENNTPVRKGATVSYDVAVTLQANETVTVIDSFTNAAGEFWYRVDLGDIKGWVQEKYFVPAEEPAQDEPALSSETGYIKNSSAHVRKGASDIYDIVATLTFNQQIKIIDEFTNSNNELWYRVELGPDKRGWINAQSVSKSDLSGNARTMYVSVSSYANIRSGPSLSSSIVDTYANGTALLVMDSEIDSSGDIWYMFVRENGQTAWIHSSIVTEKEVQSNQSRTIGTNNAYIFKGATFQYERKEKLPLSSTVTVLREFINSNHERWFNVKTASGASGWVPSWEFVSRTDDIIYMTGAGSLRRGASDSYSSNASLYKDQPLLLLRSYGDWYNAETLSGERGWVKKSVTTTVSPVRLITPEKVYSNGNYYLVWKKVQDFNLTYQPISPTQFKLTGDMTSIEIPSFSIPGIKDYKLTLNDDNTKSLLVTLNSSYTYTIRNHSDKLTVKPMIKGLSGKKIILDAGHGDHDPGAIGPTGLKEKDLNLAMAKILKTELEANGAQVLLTRSSDIFLELSERTAIANASDYDAFISLHGDSYSSTSRGTSTFYNTSVNFNGPKSKQMAVSVQNHLYSELGTYNRGTYDNRLYVTRNNELPSILVELAFLSNPYEEAKLKTAEFRQKGAVGIRKGLEYYFTNY